MRNKELCIEVVNKIGILLQYVPLELRDDEMCKIAIKHEKTALKYVPDNLQYKILEYYDINKSI